MTDKKAIPTMAGTTYGYIPQHKPNGEWKDILTYKALDNTGVSARYMDYIPAQMCMMTYAQAMAILWTAKANADATNIPIKTRIQKYKIKYDIKCYEENAETVPMMENEE